MKQVTQILVSMPLASYGLQNLRHFITIVLCLSCPTDESAVRRVSFILN
jgi:hypothetical protein